MGMTALLVMPVIRGGRWILRIDQPSIAVMLVSPLKPKATPVVIDIGAITSIFRTLTEPRLTSYRPPR
jgi:hypothetical protein